MTKRIMGLLIIILTIANVYTLLHFNDQNKQLKEEIKNKSGSYKKVKAELKNKENTILKMENEGKPKNTFDEDINWMITVIYENTNRAKIYKEISPSLTKKAVDTLFGEKKDYENEDVVENSIDKTVENVNVFGKYVSDKKFEALASFDLETIVNNVSETQFIVVKIVAVKEGNKWLVDDIEEIAATLKE